MIPNDPSTPPLFKQYLLPIWIRALSSLQRAWKQPSDIIAPCKSYEDVIMILTAKYGTSCLAPSVNSRVHFLPKYSKLKRLKLTRILVSVTKVSCSAVLPTASPWHLSGTSTCINTNMWESHRHYMWCCSRVFCFISCKMESIILLHSFFIVGSVNCIEEICRVHQ